MLRKIVLLFAVFCFGVCCNHTCHASLKVDIKKPGFEISSENPTAEEVLIISSLQKDQILSEVLNKSLEQALKGCNKKSLLEKIFGKK